MTANGDIYTDANGVTHYPDGSISGYGQQASNVVNVPIEAIEKFTTTGSNPTPDTPNLNDNTKTVHINNADVNTSDFKLQYCEKCHQMTNHLDDVCQKCYTSDKELKTDINHLMTVLITGEMDRIDVEAQLYSLINHKLEAELLNWFELPKHYKGEEYRDEPFVKVKCKTPKMIKYYTLDSNFTWAILDRIKQLQDYKKKGSK